MKTITILLLLLMTNSSFAQLKIVTTTPDFADIARNIGGDKVSVYSIMKGPENIHKVLAKPTEMVKLNDADLFVHSGLDTEPWRDNLLRGARNPKVNADQPGNVDMSQGIDLKDVPAGRIDRSQGDLHAYGNPHYSLKIANVQRMTVTLLRAMSKADPANAEFYKTNAKSFVIRMAELDKELKQQFAPYAGLKVVTFHKAWSYFADTVAIQIVGTIEPQVAITPSANQVQQIVELMKREGAKVVICETYDDSKLAASVAEKAGATMVVLPDHVNGVAGADTYEKVFRYNVAKLIEAAKAAGVQ